MADGNVQGTSWGLGNSHLPLEASGWHRVWWLQVGEASSSVGLRRGSSDTASLWAVSVLGVCLPACLPLCCSEGGRGWACSCLGRAAPASCVGHSSSLWCQTHCFVPHPPPQSMWGIRPASPGKTVEVSVSRWSSQAPGKCSGNGPGWGQPLEGCGELRLGVSCIQSCVVVGTAGPRHHPALGWSLSCRGGTDSRLKGGVQDAQGQTRYREERQAILASFQAKEMLQRTRG